MSWIAAIWAAFAALLAAGLAVTRPSVVHGLLFLLAALICLGMAFFALAANFAGAIQLLIYAGAVTAVFVFVVMTIEAGPEALAEERRRLKAAWPAPAAVTGIAVLPILAGLGFGEADPGTPAAVGAREVGLLMFGDWAVLTELVTLLLLAALIGVHHLGRRGPKRPEPGDTE